MSKSNKMVAKLRMIAEQLKKNKSRIRVNVLAKFDKGFEGSKQVVTVYQRVYSTASSVMNIADRIIKNPTVVRMAGDLVEQCVVDVANRINQVGSIVEAASKDEGIVSAMNDITDACESLKKDLTALAKARHSKKTASRKGRKFTVVK